MKGMLSLLLISVVGWIDFASLPRANWDNLAVGEKKAICQLVADKYLKAYPWCYKVDMEIKEGNENVVFSVKCVGRCL